MSCSKMMKPKISSIECMPPEVLSLIFAKLPAKTVLSLRCVCKSWCAIINHPHFVNLHFKLCNNNKSSTKFLSLERLGTTRDGGCSLTIREADNLENIDLIFTSSEKYDLNGTCHSLLLISRSRNCMYKRLTLYNPSIRKSLHLPPCPLLPSHGYSSTFVLGFVPHSQDYKIIAIAFKCILGVEVSEMRVAVYTLSDQQWAVRDNVLNIDYLSFKNLFGPYYFCEGEAHWLGNGPYGNSRKQFEYPTHLVSLDFDSENFTFLELPAALKDIDTTSGSLFILGDSLAFFCISPTRLSVWVLKQENGKRVWNQWFSGRSSSAGFDLFDFVGSTTQRVIYCEGDGGYLVYWNKSYNIATRQVREIGKSMSQDVDGATYFESVALLNKFDTNQSNCEVTLMDDVGTTLSLSPPPSLLLLN